MIKLKEVSMMRILVLERKAMEKTISLVKVNKLMLHKQIIHKKQRTHFPLRVMIKNNRISTLMRNLKNFSMRKEKQSLNKYKTFNKDPIK